MLPENYEKTLEKEGILINSENKKIYIEYTNSAIHDDKGEIAGFVFVFRDITEKKRMTEELLKNKKLESIGVLAGGIAHDFNNILTAVVGNLSLAKMELDPDSEVYNWIDLSERSSLRATNLTKQLLTFSKGGSPIKSNASIDKLIEETATFILRGSNVTFRTRFEKGLPKINMDSGQISQVIQNLIFNAQKAMPDGGTIEIEVKNKNLTGKNLKTPLKTGKYLEITIKDEGTGISKEHIDKIFDPFYTTDNSSSGLGLSIAYSIIKNHNGSISVKSTPGKGAAFTIYLPATSAHTEEEKEETSSSKMISGRGRILVMDDENEVLKVASGILKSMGYEVITAKDGNSAIRVYSEHLENNPFTAVIMDLTIPGGMGGKEAVKELLKLDSNAVVFVSSGYSNDPVMAEFQKYGFKGRIKKPYNLNEISLLLSGLNTA
jgi:signal transduction histidine kinase/CheY-like chemotaxis protein